jgi:LCP family protein required for cell wall assembly
MAQNQSPPPSAAKKTNWLLIALLAVFLLAALLTAYLTFVAVRDFVLSWSLTQLPGIAISDSGQPLPTSGAGTPAPIQDAQTPLQAVGGPTPEPWDGASRVTLLVMGLDYRDWLAGEGAPRTDSMILLTLDPLNRTAGMISIPRDLWVTIPGGFDNNRINTAYSLGEQYKVPGGGPAQAMATVESLLGVPVDYYALVDFNAFIRFIDEIGGVKINIPEKIKVDPLGDNNTRTLKPGIQTLPGSLALAYARVRKGEGDDFGRAQRQQQVIMAIRNQLIRPQMLPELIAKAPVLYNELSSGIKTNLNLEQVIKLAWMAQQVPEEDIKKGVIAPPDMVLLSKSTEGDDVLKPIMDKIRRMRDEVFFGTEKASPAALSMSPVELVQAEAPRLTVLNGTSETGMAARTTEFLQAQGIPVANTGNADQLYSSTTVIDHTGKPYTLRFLVDTMKITPNNIFVRYDPASPDDVVLILGQDWATSNPMP